MAARSIRRARRVFAASIVAGTLVMPAAHAAPGSALVACGHVDGTVAVAAQGLSCRTARGVARAYLKALRNPTGYRCRRHSIDVAAGWWASCTRGAATVKITPE